MAFLPQTNAWRNKHVLVNTEAIVTVIKTSLFLRILGVYDPLKKGGLCVSTFHGFLLHVSLICHLLDEEVTLSCWNLETEGLEPEPFVLSV